MRFSHILHRWPGAAGVAFALLLAGSAHEAHAQTCVTRTECVDINQPFTVQPAHVVITPRMADTVTRAGPYALTFQFGDDQALDPLSASYSATPGTLTQFTPWKWTKQYTSASSGAALTLAPGLNTITAHVCDNGGRCGDTQMTVFYKAPPVPEQHAAPVVANALSGERRNYARCDACLDPVLAYTTPSYTSLDQARSVTLMYSRAQARMVATVDVEVTDHSVEAPTRMSIRVNDAAGAVVAAETFYQAGNGANRLGAMWVAGGTTRSSVHTVIVRSYWADGSYRETSLPVRLSFVDESGSPFGAGWSMAGLQRVYVQSDGALVSDGSGGMAFFALAGGVYTGAAGETSQLSYDAGTGTYTRGYPDGTQVTFTGTGYQTRVADRFGNATQYQWTTSAAGTMVPWRIIDPVGKITELAYGTAAGAGYGRLATLTDPMGRVSSFTYSAAQDLISVTDPANGTALQATYQDPTHLLTGWTDVRGGRWDVAYGTWGIESVQAPVQSDGSTTGRQAVLFRSREAAVLPLAGTGSFAAPARRVIPDSAQAVITAPTGGVTRVLSDAFGNALRVLAPADTQAVSRNARGQLTAMSDARGNVVTYSYEAGFPYRVTGMAVWGPDGERSVEMQYGAYSQPLKLTYSSGLVVDYVLDGLGRRTGAKIASVTRATWGYDARGRVTSETDAGGHVTTYGYQPAPGLENVATITTDGSVRQMEYDAAGRQVRTLKDGVASDSIAFDGLNRAARLRNAAGGVTTFGYDGSRPEPNDVADPLNQHYRSLRNTLGQVIQETDPANAVQLFTYHPSTGLPHVQTNRRGGTITLDYDTQNRPWHRTADGAATTWSYDPGGRWAAASNAVSTDTIRYDADGKVTESVTIRAGQRFSVLHTYTDRNQPDSIIVTGPWGARSYLYAYDGEGRFTALRDYAGRWTQMKLNAEGLPDSVRLPTNASMRLSFAFGSRHQVLRSGPAATGTTPPAQLAHRYQYDALGLMTADSTGGAAGRLNLYTYDALRRVASWELYQYNRKIVCSGRDCRTVEVDSLAQWQGFTWDAVGNPQGASLGAGNRLLGYAGYTMTYDADGNLTRRYNSSGFDQTLGWNTLGQLTSVSRVGGASVAYAYDGFGRRVRRTDQGTGAVVQSIYDGDDLALEVDVSGNLIREYSYYPGVDAPHSMRQWANGEGGAMYYYVLHQPGHVSGLVNTADQVVNSYRYTPFGTPVTGGAVQGTVNPLQYMGRELDAGTGLYYVRNRWYDPQQGRFISEDPIGLQGGINAYTYVGDSPLNALDPMGLAGCPKGYHVFHFANGDGCKSNADGTILLEPMPPTPTERTQDPQSGGGAPGSTPGATGGTAHPAGTAARPSFASCFVNDTWNNLKETHGTLGWAVKTSLAYSVTYDAQVEIGSSGLLRPSIQWAVNSIRSGTPAVFRGVIAGAEVEGTVGALAVYGEGAAMLAGAALLFEGGLLIGSSGQALVRCAMR